MAGFALFIAVSSAMSISLIAGARRSSSVVERFTAAGYHFDVLLFPLDRDEALSLPGVTNVAINAYVASAVVDASGASVGGVDSSLVDFAAPLDPRFRVLRGKVPDGRDPFEVVVNEGFVVAFGKDVGDRVTLRMYALDQMADLERAIYVPTGPSYEFTITAVFRHPGEVATSEYRWSGGSHGERLAVLSAGFYEQHGDEFLGFGIGFALQLDKGADGVSAATDAAAALHTLEFVSTVDPVESLRPSLSSSVQVETLILLLIGVGSCVVSAALIVVFVRTQQRNHDRDARELQALGFTRQQLAGLAVARILPATLLGTLVGSVAAIGLSGRFPIGVGSKLELQSGLQINTAVVAIGAVATLVLVTVVSVVASLKQPRTSSVASRVGVVHRLHRAGAPTEMTLGAQFAFDGRLGRRSSTTMQGVATCVIGLVAMGTMSMWIGGVDRLYNVPARHGWNWDVVVGNTNFDLPETTLNRIKDDPRVAGQTIAASGVAFLNGAESFVLVIDPAGTAPPIVLSGRLPTSPSEIALGGRTANDLGVNVGDSVTFSAGGAGEAANDGTTHESTLTMVGTVLVPPIGDGDLSNVSVLTFDAVHAATGNELVPQLVLVNLAEPVSASALADFSSDFSEEKLLDLIPARVTTLHQVTGVVLFGLALAGALGTLALVFTLMAGIRSRRSDMAVLRAIGLDSKGLRRVLLWQAGLTSLVIVAIAIPLTVLVGAALWGRIVNDLAVQPGLAVPTKLFIVIPACIAVAIATVAIVGRRARRVQLAKALWVQ